VIGALGLAALLAVEPLRLVSVRSAVLESRPAVEVVTSGMLSAVGVRRDGLEVVLTLAADGSGVTSEVPARPPLESIRVERAPLGVAVRIRVAPEIAYEVRRQGSVLTVLFEARVLEPMAPPAPRSSGASPPPVASPVVTVPNTPSPAPSGAPTAAAPADTARPSKTTAEVLDLYRRILPVAPVPVDETTGAPGTGERNDTPDPTAAAEGLHIGLLTLRPAVTGVYIDADAALLDTPQPVRDQYYELRPSLSGELPIRTGRLTAGYEARIRRDPSFAVIQSTTHTLDAGLELPVGPTLLVNASDHHVRGVLETTEVDPGREYFYGLGPFKHNSAGVGARLTTGGRLDIQLAGSHDGVRVEPPSSFFSHDRWEALAGVGLEMRPNLRARVAYQFERVPAPSDRPEAESTAHVASVRLAGEVLPLVTGFLDVGIEDRRSAQAAAEGRRYRGLALSGRLVKEFSRSTTLQVQLSRTTPPSAFESNGFYVASSVLGQLTLPLPFSVAMTGGVGYYWNDYRTVASEIGAPRRDRLLGWSFGLGRPVTAWGFVRVDYRRERRDSNVDRFDTHARAFTVQAGVRMFRVVEH
jgi:hypothetical protein